MPERDARKTPYAIEDSLFGEIVLFSTTENVPYAAVKVENRVITAPTDSHEFKIMLAHCHVQKRRFRPAQKGNKQGGS